MKGEIIRRMSMEIMKDDGVDLAQPVRKEKEKAEDDDDYLVKTIGAFGLWQAVVSVTVLLTRAIMAWNVMSLPFLAPVTEFVCIEFSDNVTTAGKSSICYDNCSKYNYSSVIGRSIIEDFGLICENAWLADFTQSILMMGFLFGVLLFGWLSDRFGRRSAIILSTLLNAIFMIALPFSPNYIIFTSIRFVIGIATGGVMFTSVVQVMEILGKRYIEIAGMCVLIPECLGQASLPGFAYFNSNWQGYTLSYGVATCFIFVLVLFVPESPRWLLVNGKIDETIKMITSAANRNKLDTSNVRAEIMKAVENMKLNESEDVTMSYIDLIRSKTLFISTLAIIIIWFALCLCYYGIYQYVANIGINLYLTMVILSLIQIPIYPMGVILNKKLGRKISTTVTAISIAIFTIILMFVQKRSWLGTILGIAAFSSTNICFFISYVHMSEIYPTPLRNMSYGLVSCGAKIGAMIAPFIADLLPRWLPSLIFCIAAIIAGVCCLALPETKGRNLKDVIDKK